MLFLQNTRIVDEHQSEKTRNQLNNSFVRGSKQYSMQISPKTMFQTIVP